MGFGENGRRKPSGRLIFGEYVTSRTRCINADNNGCASFDHGTVNVAVDLVCYSVSRQRANKRLAHL